MSGLQDFWRFLRYSLGRPVSIPERVLPLPRFAFRQIHKRLTGRSLFISWEGLSLEVPPGSTSGGAAYYFGRQDLWELSFLEDFLRAGDCAADVGANIGVYTIFMARHVGPSGLVIAAEPDPTNLRYLKANAEANGLKQIRIEPKAVAASEGTTRFAAGQDAIGHITTDPGALEVPQTTMDTLCGDRPPVYVKVDVEGYETGVLQGSTALLRAGNPLVWQMELLTTHRGANDEVVRILRDAGYEFYTYNPASRSLDKQAPDRLDGNNVLAIRDVAAVQARLQRPS